MSLTFLNPLFLFGLALGIIPILIHRLTKKKPISRKFSAVRLLLQSQRIMTKPQRLKHLLLLALRILAVILLVLMMARPVLTHKGLLPLGEESARVLILDNSLSMTYQEEQGERFELAKKVARDVLQEIKGPVILIPTAAEQGVPILNEEVGWTSREEAMKKLNALSCSYAQGSPLDALRLAYEKFKGQELPKEILFISDLARGDWEGFNLGQMGRVSTDIKITFIRIGGPKQDANLAIKGVRLDEGEAVVGTPNRLEVTVSNLAEQTNSALVQLFLGGVSVEKKAMDLQAGEEGKVYFEFFQDRPAWINGEVRLSGDRLPLDDVFYFPLRIREKIKVLIVDGDPALSLRGRESYYLLNALNPGGREGSPFLAKVISAEELDGLDLSSFEALFLLNVARPTPAKMLSFAEAGKPVWLFLGDRVNADHYNSMPLFPWRLRAFKEAAGQKPPRISQVDPSHEALKLFSGAAGDSLKGASFRRYYPVDGATKKLLILDNQDPLLLEASLGKGKLFLFASSADLDWNDLPLKTAYLPLIQGLLKAAVGLKQDSLTAPIQEASFPGKSRPLQILGPKGGPGIYQILQPSGEERWGVNIPREESDLAKVNDSDMQKKFPNIEIQFVEYQRGLLNTQQAEKKEIWPYFLAILLAALAFEMVVANRI
jgi:hypothetical protein